MFKIAAWGFPHQGGKEGVFILFFKLEAYLIKKISKNKNLNELVTM